MLDKVINRGVTLSGNIKTSYTTNDGVLISGTVYQDQSLINTGVAIYGKTAGSAICGGGVCLFGDNATCSSAGTIIAGNNFTKIGEAYGGIFICNNNATFNRMIYGNSTYICGGNATLSEISVSNSISGQNTKFNNYDILKGFRVMIDTPTDAPIDNFQQRMGITIVGYASSNYEANLNIDKTYKIYYPSHLNYSAQTYGYVRYTDKMNITDPDGEYIIKDGKLNEDYINSLIEAKLEERLSEILSLNKDNK